MKTLLAIVGILLLPTTVFAQTMPPNVQPGDPVRLQWDYDATQLANRPVTFRIYLDGAKLHDVAAADYVMSTASGTNTYALNAGVLASFTVAQAGSHTFAITAFDATGESAQSADALAFTVGFVGAPGSPSGLQFFIPKVGFNPQTGEVKFFLVPAPAAPATVAVTGGGGQ